MDVELSAFWIIAGGGMSMREPGSRDQDFFGVFEGLVRCLAGAALGIVLLFTWAA